MNKNLIEQLRIAEEITEELNRLQGDIQEVIACFHDATDGLEDEYPQCRADVIYVKSQFEETMKRGSELYQ